jgi:hypothetical protein
MQDGGLSLENYIAALFVDNFSYHFIIMEMYVKDNK